MRKTTANKYFMNAKCKDKDTYFKSPRKLPYACLLFQVVSFRKFVFWAWIVKHKFYLKGWGWNRIIFLWYWNENLTVYEYENKWILYLYFKISYFETFQVLHYWYNQTIINSRWSGECNEVNYKVTFFCFLKEWVCSRCW